jgi:hemoglobin-like flavoprotein
MINAAEKAQKKSDEISDSDKKEFIKLVQDSWKLVEPIRLQAADIFYEKMFTTNENVAKLFSKTNMVQQKDKLTKSIGFAVGKLDDLDALIPVLEEMGVKYVHLRFLVIFSRTRFFFYADFFCEVFSDVFFHRHISYGTLPEHYDVVGSCLLYTLEKGKKKLQTKTAVKKSRKKQRKNI